MCICIHIDVYTPTYIHTFMYNLSMLASQFYVCICIQTCIHKSMHVYKHVVTCKCMHTYVQMAHVYACILK